LVLPTLNDCFPLVILEAMRAGLPVVATDEGAIPEIVDDEVTGYIVPKNQPENLADKLELLLYDPELRKRMGGAGRNRFLEKYTLDKFESGLLTIFQNVLTQ